ncbi:MAG: DNA starvation/stationary phase protection protein Dps [Alphaproteobacteria bacterium]|jgi:starvation-inducible DNA-binding protein|nr:DNA starvation/stationary phase protection protein Dps [Alphaproteobacteria bacterium]
MNPTRNGLSESTRKAVIEVLNARLADALDLAAIAKQAHWNVKGPHFMPLHEMFDSLTDAVRDHADEIAERAVALGGMAAGRTQDVANASKLDQYPADITKGSDHVAAVADRLAAVTNAMRDAIDATEEAGDAVTADLFTGVTADLDKQLWFVESHLQKA